MGRGSSLSLHFLCPSSSNLFKFILWNQELQVNLTTANIENMKNLIQTDKYPNWVTLLIGLFLKTWILSQFLRSSLQIQSAITVIIHPTCDVSSPHVCAVIFQLLKLWNNESGEFIVEQFQQL